MLGLLSRKESKSILKTASDDADTLSLAHEKNASFALSDGESVTTSKLDDKEFEFDSEIINTAAYRKVFNKARSKLPPKKGTRSQSIRPTGSLPLNSNIQRPHNPSDKSHLDPKGYSLFDGFLETDVDQGNHPSSTNSIISDLYHHSTPQDYFYVHTAPQRQPPLLNDCQPGTQRPLRHPGAWSQGDKPLPTLPAQSEEPDFDFNWI